ncbi:hypothetical protein ACHAWU_005858 [Discostella pseudostelligera]|uniref:Uncharacterized protein n=1 Tax=Discostella pseudostelligera TaxID=259834 RepID=A0ABD3N6Y3_9STRA
MMLSGIKTGKRKRPAVGAPIRISGLSSAVAPPTAAAATAVADGGATVGGGGNSNRSAAEAMRRSLQDDDGHKYKQHDESDNFIHSKLHARASSFKNNELVVQGLQNRGRISNDVVSTKSQTDNETIVIHSDSGNKSTIQYEHEHNVRYNSKGKLSRHAHDQLRQKSEQDMSINDMVAQEKHVNDKNNMDDTYLRNVIKMGSKGYKKLEKAMGIQSRSGADEDDYLQDASALHNLYRSNDDKLSPAELEARSKSRQIAHHDALSKWTAKSWWWMESPSFDKKYLIALGEKVSLVMTPSHRRLHQPQQKSSSRNVRSSSGGGGGGGGVWEGGQCYIVPLPYSESFVALDEEVWYEVKRFQGALRQMFLKEGRGVIFLETVMKTSRSASGGAGSGVGGGTALQAKMDVIPVPLSVERDAPLYFRSALAEVAQEWGTHGLKPITLDGQKKTLRNSVPKMGFPYFYCGWGVDEGYVQLIENEDDGDDGGYGGGGGGGMRGGGGSKRFSRDFGIDIIGGMMDCDPIRFQRKSLSGDGDRSEVLQFCEKWKDFDWTLELDE